MTTEKHLLVSRTARYFAIGDAGPEVTEVWFALHGYGQLAASLARQCEPLADPRRLVLVPEALSRFYLGDHVRPAGPDSRIGASWMTREDREHEIADYVRYLDQLYASTFESIRRESVTVHVLGFSQGTATASRWVTGGQVRADRLIAWGSPLPADIEHDPSRLRSVPVVIVAGDHDEYLTPKVIALEEARLTRLQVAFQTVRFKGKHAIDADVLRQLADDKREEGRGKREE